MKASLFEMGQIVATPGALAALEGDEQQADFHMFCLLSRHAKGDWSEMPDEDQDTNRGAVKHGGRIFSAYTIGGTEFWVITERDRTVTTILLPSEY